MVLRVNTEEMQVEILLDAPVADAIALMAPEGAGQRVLLSRLVKIVKPRSEIKVRREIHYESHTIRELESGTIELELNGAVVCPVLPALRELALGLNVPL